jgi:hypothetical protein
MYALKVVLIARWSHVAMKLPMKAYLKAQVWFW